LQLNILDVCNKLMDWLVRKILSRREIESFYRASVLSIPLFRFQRYSSTYPAY